MLKDIQSVGGKFLKDEILILTFLRIR